MDQSQTPAPAIEGQGAQGAQLQGLGDRLRAEFIMAEAARREQEEEWLKDLRQYKGMYDPEVIARIHPNRSHTFIRLTRAKVKSVDARMGSLLFPAGDKNWSLNPTPVPDLDQKKHLLLVAQMMQDRAQAGNPQPPTDKEALEYVKAAAAEACAEMVEEIEDQLDDDDLGYEAQSRKVMHSGHLYGTGILKGPITERHQQQRWQQNMQPAGGGSYAQSFGLEVTETIRPWYGFLPVWRCYPDPFAVDLADCDYLYEEHIFNRHQLLSLAKRRGFDVLAVQQYLSSHPEGDATLKIWEDELRRIAGTRDLIGPLKNRFRLLERWGFLYGKDLQECGLPGNWSGENEMMEFEARVFLLGNIVVKASLNPLPKEYRPYHFYYLDKDETNIWGNGVPYVLRDTQMGTNGSIRLAMDNAAIAGGPQIEANRDLLEDEDNLEDIIPFRVWIRSGFQREADAPALRVYNIDSHVAEYVDLAKTFKDLGDEVSTLPSYTQGTPGTDLAKTVGGLSMLLGQANITLKDAAKAWDDGITTPFFCSMYDWNMEFNERQDIKGDYNVEARGASSLVAKELRSHALDAFAATSMNPFVGPFTKWPQLQRERAKALDLPVDEIVVTDEELKDQQEAQAQQPGGPPGPSKPLPDAPPSGASIPPNASATGITAATAAGAPTQ